MTLMCWWLSVTKTTSKWPSFVISTVVRLKIAKFAWIKTKSPVIRHTHNTETCMHTWWVPALCTPHESSSLTSSPSWFCVSYLTSTFPWSWTHTHATKKHNINHTVTRRAEFFPKPAATGHQKASRLNDAQTEGLSWVDNDKMSSTITQQVTIWKICTICTHTHLLAAEEEEVQPEPGEDQHDDGDGEAEDEPRAEIDHLCIWITTAITKRYRELL